MKKPTPEDRDRFRRLAEQGEAARRQMQEILDRVEARRLEREAWQQRSLIRRLLPW
jgi:hypothetical protein